jgi:acyl-CoA thioesterase YciA
MKEYLKISLLPKDTNMYGTIFGGVIMSHLDLAAAHCCRDTYANRFVTKFIHEMSFLHPVYVGDLVIFNAEIIAAGTTSVTVHVLVDAERLGTKDLHRVTEAKLVFVAVDESGCKTPLVLRAGGRPPA